VCKVKTLYTSKGKQHSYTENNVLVVNLYVLVVVDLFVAKAAHLGVNADSGDYFFTLYTKSN
jgi:hypothetical protein